MKKKRRKAIHHKHPQASMMNFMKNLNKQDADTRRRILIILILSISLSRKFLIRDIEIDQFVAKKIFI